MVLIPKGTVISGIISITDTKTISLLPYLLFPLSSSSAFYHLAICIPGKVTELLYFSILMLSFPLLPFEVLSPPSQLCQIYMILSYPSPFLRISTFLLPLCWPFQFSLSVIMWPETALITQIMVIPLALPLEFLVLSLVAAACTLQSLNARWLFTRAHPQLTSPPLALCMLLLITLSSPHMHPSIHPSMFMHKGKFKCCFHKASLLGH